MELGVCGSIFSMLVLSSFTFSYIHFDILKNGGYTGYFCIEQASINDSNFSCYEQMENCTGKGKMEFYDDKIPLNENYYKGYKRKCKLNCNFNEIQYKVNGKEERNYIFIHRNLKFINSTYFVKDNSFYYAWIEYLDLIIVEDIKIEFNDKFFNCTNITINNNVLKCLISVKNDYSGETKFASSVKLIYGNKLCRKPLNLGYVLVQKSKHVFLTDPNVSLRAHSILLGVCTGIVTALIISTIFILVTIKIYNKKKAQLHSTEKTTNNSKVTENQYDLQYDYGKNEKKNSLEESDDLLVEFPENEKKVYLEDYSMYLQLESHSNGIRSTVI